MARAPAALLILLGASVLAASVLAASDLAASDLAAPAQACATGLDANVPCGYIYPRLVLDLGARGASQELRAAQPLDLEGTLTFTWDISAEGLAANDPLTPIVVSFAYPGAPDWLDARIEPANLTIPIDPSHIATQPTATGVQLTYNYTAPIALHARLNGTPVLPAGGEPPSLLIVARSSESGFYKPGFGVRDLPLRLPDAVVQQRGEARPAALRIGEPLPFDLGTLTSAFQGADFALRSDGPLRMWEPARLTATVQHAGSPVTSLDMAVSVVDERNEVLSTSGLLHKDGALPFSFTFPGPGNYRVLVAARPLAGATSYLFDPVVADFPFTLQPVDADALRMPAKYRALYDEPASEVHANTQDLPRQFEKQYRFPVADGAAAVSAQVTLGAGAAGVGAGSMYAELLGPGGEQLGYGKLDALTPQLDLQLRDGIAAGEYRVHIYGTGLDPQGLAGTTLRTSIAAFYDAPPLLPVRVQGWPRPLAGDPVALGTGGVEAQLVLAHAPAVWQPVEGTLLVKDARGQVALHPDFILTVSLPNGTVLYTTGHRHPHDGLLPASFTPDAPGTYIVSAFSGPTPEASGAFWQPAIASWPLVVPAPPDLLLPPAWHGHFHESTSSVRVSTEQGYAYVKEFAVPVLPGATRLDAQLDLGTMAVVQHVEGGGPAALTLGLVPPGAGYASAASQQAVVLGGAQVHVVAPAAGTWTVRVQGVGYAPLDYSGAMYNLTIRAQYAEAPRLLAASPAPPPPHATPGFEALLLLAGLGLAARRRRGF